MRHRNARDSSSESSEDESPVDFKRRKVTSPLKDSKGEGGRNGTTSILTTVSNGRVGVEGDCGNGSRGSRDSSLVGFYRRGPPKGYLDRDDPDGGQDSSISFGRGREVVQNGQKYYKRFQSQSYVDRDHCGEDGSVPLGRRLDLKNILTTKSNSAEQAPVAPRLSVPGESKPVTSTPCARPFTTTVSLGSQKSDLSSSEIGKIMGFETKKGLAQYLDETPKQSMDSGDKSPEMFEKRIKELGIDVIGVEMPTLTGAVKKEISWLRSSEFKDAPKFTLEGLLEARKIGPKIQEVTIDKDNGFMLPDAFEVLQKHKILFHSMDAQAYQRCRAKANLFERIESGPFMCRAAMKMADLDARLNMELTEPKRPDGSPAIAPQSIMYFADVCAGPGGFSEYILWRKNWETKGFGMTLKGELDFDLKKFAAGTETFEVFYGEAGDGNIYNPVNAAGFIHHVLACTDNKGVHLMMADGGFTWTKQELQEVLCYQIILSQVYVALGAVRVGGHFICKVFDTVTPFTVALLYFLYMCFDNIAIHKPFTSRPANSERYVICKWKKSSDQIRVIIEYLANCHRMMWEMQQDECGTEQILELLPISTITNILDPFYMYMMRNNARLAEEQVTSLKQIVMFAQNEFLDNRNEQEKARAWAMKQWKIPERIPARCLPVACDIACAQLLDELPLTMLKHPEKKLLDHKVAEAHFKSAYDWRFVPVMTSPKHALNRGFYMSLGQNLVYRYSGTQWIVLEQKEPLLELPSKTLLYGEFVYEIYGKGGNCQTLVETFHIIDALCLGGVSLKILHYTARQELCAKFAKAVSKRGNVPVRAKVPVRMENLVDFVGRVECRVVKGSGVGQKLVCPVDMNDPCSPFILAEGLLFLKITRDPWVMALDRERKKKYFFNKFNGQSKDDIPDNAVAGFFHTMAQRTLWPWDAETNVILTKVEPNDPRIRSLNPNRVHTCQLWSYIWYTINMTPSKIDLSPTLNEKKEAENNS